MRACASLLVLCGGLLAASPAAASPEVEEVEECVRGNLPQKSSVQTVALRAVDRMGGQRSLSGKLYWQRSSDDRSRMLMKLEAPPDLRGSSYLMLEKEDDVDVFVYLPELKRVRRITSHAMSGSLFGTDFSYEDFRRLQRIASEAGSARLPDTELDARPVYVLRITPPPEDASEYERVHVFVDRETCVPLKLELYERGERVRKVISVDPAEIAREGDVWVPRKLKIRDLKDETETRLVVEKVEIDKDLPERLFSQSALARGH